MSGTEVPVKGIPAAEPGNGPSRPERERAGSRQRVSWRIVGYLMREMLKTFVFVLVILEFCYSILVAVGAAQQMQLELPLVLPLVWLVAISTLADAIPLALIFAVSLVIGRFLADREIMALKSFGLSYRHLLLPAMLLGLVFGGGAFVINTRVGPSAHSQKRDVGRLIAEQFRYLGEGWNRDLLKSVKRSPVNLWVRHYSGRQLEGIFLSPKSDRKDDPFLSEDRLDDVEPGVSRYYIYAERGRILFADELEAEGVDTAEWLGRESGSDAPLTGAIVIELSGINVFTSDRFLGQGSDSFLHRLHIGRYYYVKDFGAKRNKKSRKGMTAGELTAQIGVIEEQIAATEEQIRAAVEQIRTTEEQILATSVEDEKSRQLVAASRANVAVSREQVEDSRENVGDWGRQIIKIRTEYHERLARTCVCVLFPVLAGLIAFWLNSENRLVPFFVASTVLPGVFYGLATIGRLLAQAGVPSWAAMYSGPTLLATVALVGLWLLEKKVLR